MMTNLFSIFDPSMSLFSFSWIICLLVLFFLPGLFWFSGCFFIVVSYYLSLFKVEVDYVIFNFVKGLYIFMGSVFLVVSFYNFFAMFPFIFSATSHLLVTLPLAFSIWVGIILFSWMKSFSSFLSHLIPTGTPFFLISFMVLVEILSNFIRPIALTFRLTANMMAGHLLMGLIGGFFLSLPFSITIVGSLFQSLLVLMELGVSLIQAYVFFTLLLLYLSESDF